jgi:hypothetical protein
VIPSFLPRHDLLHVCKRPSRWIVSNLIGTVKERAARLSTSARLDFLEAVLSLPAETVETIIVGLQLDTPGHEAG